MKKTLFTLAALACCMVGTWVASSCSEKENKNSDDATAQHEYVDLALPSGTLWATCNVGAEKPEEQGYHVAWGEVAEKDTCGWGNYKWCEGTLDTMNKYCVESKRGTVDGLSELEPEDDAAIAFWGNEWKTPTMDQLLELSDSTLCTWTWTTLNEVPGYQVTSKKNGKSLFLPAAGYIGDKAIEVGEDGYYWSTTLYDEGAFIVGFDANQLYKNGSYRCYGQSVRAVRAKK